MEVIPAIDIRGGRCVRLYQGDYAQETVFDEDPVRVAVRWAEQGASRIHVVDLDGARAGHPVNAELVRTIAETVDCAVQTGGGIRDIQALRTCLYAGVNRVVLGTAAVRDEAMLREAVAVAGDRLIVSVDALDGKVRTAGWTEASDLNALPFIEQLGAMGVQRIVYTEISRDGAGSGPDLAAYRRLTAETSMEVIAAGGVSSVDDVRALAACGVAGAIVGRALYTGAVLLPEAMQAARQAA